MFISNFLAGLRHRAVAQHELDCSSSRASSRTLSRVLTPAEDTQALGVLESLATPTKSSHLRKPISLIQTWETGSGLSLIERKLLNCLLHYAEYWRKSGVTHSDKFDFAVPASRLREDLGFVTQNKNAQIVTAMIKLMEQKIVLSRIKLEGREEPLVTPVIAGFSLPSRGKVLEWSFASLLNPHLAEFAIWGSVSIKVQAQFRSKYSLILYDHLSLLVNREHPIWPVSVVELRRWLGMDHVIHPDIEDAEAGQAKCKDWNAMYKRALAPALKEINRFAPFHVEMTRGRYPRTRGNNLLTFRLTNTRKRKSATRNQKEKVRNKMGLIHRTTRGEHVSSKGEVIVANCLAASGLDYEYAKILPIGDRPLHPDFTLISSKTGKAVYWEHCGMLHVPNYAETWEKKLAHYKAHQILPYEEGGGSNGMLIVTRDGPDGSIDASRIAEIISDVFAP